MKTCKNCGASINDDSRFCTQCGADTFEDNAQEETIVLADASAEPVTEPAAPEQSGEYYQPTDTVSAPSSASTYTYTAPVDQQPIGTGKGKKKTGRIVAIVVSVIIVLGIVVRFGLGALGIIGNVVSNISTLSEGYETSTEYINSSLNLVIDATKGGMEVLTKAEKESFGLNPDSYETFIYDYDTDEYIYVMIAEGNLAEAAQNLKTFVVSVAESLYSGESNYKIGDVYERDILGKTFTCVDISQTVEDPDYGTYYLEQTLCFIKDATMFLEISITTYPEETGHHSQDIIDTYIRAYK